MAQIRMFVLLLVLLILVNSALVQGKNLDGTISREKRLFGCAKVGKRCSGFLGKSCCGGTTCNSTTGKCVVKGSSTSWLGDRNGK